MNRKLNTIKVSGGDYAKVAERLKLFREDNPNGKQESAYEIDVDGTVVFTVWLWKDKTDLLDLMKSGITDKDALRSSSDANGNAKSSTQIVTDTTQAKKVERTKEFEKLESVALGRALAMLGYLASGEIASSEEMEEFYEFKESQRQESIAEAIEAINGSKTLEELKNVFVSLGALISEKVIIEAKDKRKAELNENN